MKQKFYLPVILTVIMIISCISTPEVISEPEPEPRREPVAEVVVVVQEEAVNEDFDPSRVTEEYYFSTRTEVQQFIQNLNQIIRSGNFEAWRRALSPELLAEISSDDNLRQLSEQPAMRTRRIVLRTAEDYFTHVVVPSRANVSDRVDNIDIEFITISRVQAFAITTNRAGEEQAVRLYDLEKINNIWTIIN